MGKRLISRLIGGILAVVIVYGAQAIVPKLTMPGKIEKLAGTYSMSDFIETDTVEDMLTDYDFYPAEISLIDMNTLSLTKYVEFRTDKTYTFHYDAEGFRENVEAFFRQAYDDLYTNRNSLTGEYGEEIVAMTQAEFQDFYVSLYSAESFDSLVASFADSAFDYDSIAQDIENGTYTIEDDTILCTINGQYEAEGLGYKLSGDALTLTYSNDVEEYTRYTP